MMDLPWHDLDKYVTAVPRLSRDSPEALLETIAMARKEYHKATMEGKDAAWWKDETTNNSISVLLFGDLWWILRWWLAGMRYIIQYIIDDWWNMHGPFI